MTKKKLFKIGNRRIIAQCNQGYALKKKPHCQHHIEWGDSGVISTKIWNRTRMPTLVTAVEYSSRRTSQGHQPRQRSHRNRP